MSRLRPRKFEIFIYFDLDDDGEYLTEVEQPLKVTVTPRDWPLYPHGQFYDHAKAVADRLGAEWR